MIAGCVVCERRVKDDLKFLTGATGRMEFPLAEVGRLQEEQIWEGEVRGHFWPYSV